MLSCVCYFSDEESKNLLRSAIAEDDDSNNVGINLDLTVNVGGPGFGCDCCEGGAGSAEGEVTPGAEGSGLLSVDNNGQTTVNLQGAAA